MIDDQTLVQVESLLKEKFQLITRLEEITDPLATLPYDDLVEGLEARGRVFEKLVALDHALEVHVEEFPALQDILTNQSSAQDLCPEYNDIWQISFTIKSIINRLLRNEGPLKDRLVQERDLALENIEKENRSGASRAAKYSVAGQTGSSMFPSTSKRRMI